MIRYLLSRLGMAAAGGLGLSVFLASLARIVPGDPATLIMGPRSSPQFAAQVREEMGLDEPIWTQVGTFLWGALRGDLGTDFVSNQPVSQIVATNLPHTVLLAFTALGIASAVGIPLGVYAASRPVTLPASDTRLYYVFPIH